MSIHAYNKDHLNKDAALVLVKPVEVDAPVSGDALLFWTQNSNEPCEVNLHPFATGQETANKNGGGRRFVPFSGRPELIRQLAPILEEALSYVAAKTVGSYMNAFREWWRILDAVEAAAMTTGQPMIRVEDVRQLTQMHSEYAHRSGMRRQPFGKFRFIVDTTRMALGAHKTHWEQPENRNTQKHIPPQEQLNSLRFEVRNECRIVMEQWAQSDLLSQSEIEPSDSQEAELWREVRYMRNIQRETGKALPKPDDLSERAPYWVINSRGNFKQRMFEAIFPSHRDADTIWHQCLLNTGWNSSTLTNLDVTKKFLIDHFKDDPNDPHQRYVLRPETYVLIGEKDRAGGKEQMVIGQWKTLDGPGHLIKTQLKRAEPLRQALKQQLVLERLKYDKLKDANYEERAAQFKRIKTLEMGVRSVWLYVDRSGKIDWLTNNGEQSVSINGKGASLLDKLILALNSQREAERSKINVQRSSVNARLTAINARRQQRGRKKFALFAPLPPSPPIPHVAPKEFRVWFADYVYRSSNGNMLRVKKALNHSRLSTTNTYINTNVLNQEASDSARRFLNILIGELEMGRVDLTILAHLHRYGDVTPEQKKLLAQARTLPKSRMKVACKDPAHPPAHLKATANEPCDVQRCMLCVEHAVLLPESLDGIAMRAEELRALQGFLPLETWIEDRYEIELKSNLLALRKFDLNLGMAARRKWADAIARGDHHVPGLPLASTPELMELA